MSMNRQGRVSRPESEATVSADTFTGNRALMLEEPLIFEIGDEETTGVDLPCAPAQAGAQSGPRPSPGHLGGLERSRPNLKLCATIRDSAARTMRSISACSRSDRAR
jgi:glycine dehydrogenase subunit 2